MAETKWLETARERIYSRCLTVFALTSPELRRERSGLTPNADIRILNGTARFRDWRRLRDREFRMGDLISSTIVCLLVDQWSKKLVEIHLGNRCVSLGARLRIRLVRRASPTYRAAGSRVLLVLLWLAAAASMFLLHHTGARFQTPTASLGLGSALGGAAGNLLDISRRRCVTDFIDMGWLPVFNFADVAISCGIVCAFWPWS